MEEYFIRGLMYLAFSKMSTVSLENFHQSGKGWVGRIIDGQHNQTYVISILPKHETPSTTDELLAQGGL